MALTLTKNSVETNELQKKIENSMSPQQTQVIGFAIDPVEEEDEDDDEDL